MMLNIAWAANGQDAGAGGLMGAFVPLILIFVIFYFLLILPQRRKQKEHQEMIKNIKKGDKIITSGGIYGTVTKVKKNYLEVEIANQVVIRLQRNAISALRGGTGEEE
ncbi:preprotein translocase subunit YajC [Candidatus Aerophobetes bacterium]|nr:preprotein translocase subunit YajC [Candidatus Aerophobetes bacterium]